MPDSREECAWNRMKPIATGSERGGCSSLLAGAVESFSFSSSSLHYVKPSERILRKSAYAGSSMYLARALVSRSLSARMNADMVESFISEESEIFLMKSSKIYSVTLLIITRLIIRQLTFFAE